MREYLVLPESLYADREALNQWLQRSFSWAAGLPPKAKKPRKTA